MSQDNQNSQPPSSPKPQKPYQTVQPIWKSTIIQFLKGTIGVLETTVEKLETEPSSATQETSWWSKFLGKIRSLLPANLSGKFSDTALTGIIAGIAVLFVWFTFGVFTGKPTEVATVPPPAEEKTVPPAEEKPVPPTAQEKPAEEKIPPTAEEKPAEEKPVPPTAEEVPSESIPTPPELTAPEPPQPVEIVPPEPTPTPTPTPILLTPEQTLIAAIENQVAEVSDRFASGLIKSIQANFRTSNLKIVISDDWYTLKESQQNKLAAEMLQRSKELDFAHVEITDFKDRLVARSPVVGTEMVIFQRRA